ncbi:MAG: FMN-binding glutamate synthase family protein [Candidatus Obscuribacterales bacterium]|nr:FMN-binding glutamate synthase family protein [Candidatus Obscuribacterales bacterium]
MFRTIHIAGVCLAVVLYILNPWLLLGLAAVALVIGICDRVQNVHALRRNYPFIGWGRYIFESIGDELRQYWFLPDDKVRPFDRERFKDLVRTGKGLSNEIGFGTEREYNAPGEIHILPSMFPVPPKANVNKLPSIVIGKKRRKPYICPSPINISGMSFGALSEEAVRALSSGALMSDIHMLTGEGGLTPYHLEGARHPLPVTSRIAWLLARGLSTVAPRYWKSPPKLKGNKIGGGRIIVQIGPAKFGFRQEDGSLDWNAIAALAENDQIVGIEIKLAQGAKPGLGGMLLAKKITREIADIRKIPMGVDCLSPNAWDEFSDVPSLMAFIARLQELTGKPVGFKMVGGKPDFIKEVAAYMKAHDCGPDFITLDGGEGGTGAAPLGHVDTVGLPIMHAIPMVDNALREAGVRDEVVLIASGKIATAADIAVHIALGADMVNMARGFLIGGLGCIQSGQCHKNTCPTGIATQDKKLRRGLDPTVKFVRVANLANGRKKELLTLIKSCGKRSPWELTRHDVSIVVEPGKEITLAERFPYPAGDDGRRNPTVKF